MGQFAAWVTMEARRGKQEEAPAFLFEAALEAQIKGPTAARTQKPDLFVAPYMITRCQPFAGKRTGANAQ